MKNKICQSLCKKCMFITAGVKCSPPLPISPSGREFFPPRCLPASLTSYATCSVPMGPSKETYARQCPQVDAVDAAIHPAARPFKLTASMAAKTAQLADNTLTSRSLALFQFRCPTPTATIPQPWPISKARAMGKWVASDSNRRPIG